jgi:MFS family permease
MASSAASRARRGGSEVPDKRVGSLWIVLIALSNLGLFMAYFGVLGVLLPDQVQVAAGPTHKVIAFGLVTGLGAVFAMIANPVAGALSDRTTGRFGRRHPWILGGALVSAGALLLLAHQRSIFGIAVMWCLGQVGLNAMQAGIVAGIPDHVPVGQRGAVSGWFGLPQVIGVVIAVALVSKVATGSAGYALLAITVVGLALPFVLFTQDLALPQTSHSTFSAFSMRTFFRAFWLSPAKFPDFAWAWLTRFLIVLGNSMAVLYLLYFLRDKIRYSRLFPGQTAEDGLVILLLIYTVLAVTMAVVGGRVSDRTGRRRRLVAISGVVMAIPAVALACWPNWPTTIGAAAILGAGFGIYLSVDQALVTQVLPSVAGRAKDLGVISVASSAAQAMAPAIAAPVVAHLGGYSALYLWVAAVLILGSITVTRIRSVP